jgi:hypothetical protein
MFNKIKRTFTYFSLRKMKTRFAIFQRFVNDLLPHEFKYLQQAMGSEDPENRCIMEQMERVVLAQETVDYDPNIDKRKYSAIISRSREKLARIDVDLHFERLNELHHRLMTDHLQPNDEKALLQMLREPQPDFYFSRLYHVMLDFRQFLLIRLRHREHKLTHSFIEAHESRYRYIRQVYEQMHAATALITAEYSRGEAVPEELSSQLLEWFNDERLDGINRYNALVRLTFLYYNRRQYDLLLPAYDAFDQMLGRGAFYSRRILANYYGNRLLIHSYLDQLQEAARYGQMSLRVRTADYIHYLNNLAAVMLRQGKASQALQLMRSSFGEYRQTVNFHNRTGFVALYVKCLNECRKPKEGEQFAENFLAAYREEVFAYRWHSLFTAYIQALMQQRKFAKIIRLVKQNKLLTKEEAYAGRINHLPTISWYFWLALYAEARLESNELQRKLLYSLQQGGSDSHRLRQLQQLSDELQHLAPNIMSGIKSEIKKINI